MKGAISGGVIFTASILLVAVSITPLAQQHDGARQPALQQNYDQMQGRLFIGGNQGYTSGLSPTLRTQAYSAAADLFTILKRNAAIVTPTGYSPYLWRIVNNNSLKGGTASPVVASYGVYGVLLFGTDLVTGQGEGPGFQVVVNDAGCAVEQEVYSPRDERGPIYGLHPEAAAHVHGFPRYLGTPESCVLVTRGSQPLFVPVAKAEYLHAAVLQAQQDYDKYVADLQRNVAEQEQNTADSRKQQAELEAVYAKASPEVRAAIDQGRRVAKEISAEETRSAQEYLRNSHDSEPWRRMQSAQSQLDRMPSSERQQEAYIAVSVPTDNTLLPAIVGKGTTGSQALVRFNPGYFDRNAPPLRPQFISISVMSCLTMEECDITAEEIETQRRRVAVLASHGAGQSDIRLKAYNAILDNIDWDALRRMLAP